MEAPAGRPAANHRLGGARVSWPRIWRPIIATWPSAAAKVAAAALVVVVVVGVVVAASAGKLKLAAHDGAADSIFRAGKQRPIQWEQWNGCKRWRRRKRQQQQQQQKQKRYKGDTLRTIIIPVCLAHAQPPACLPGRAEQDWTGLGWAR